jgi:hypothetical protein
MAQASTRQGDDDPAPASPQARPLRGPPLIASAPPTVAIERLVYSICHVTLYPLRLLSGAISRDRRRRGAA